MPPPNARYFEHAEDVLSQFLAWHASDGAALVMITGTHGGAVRDVGALMAVSATGAVAGYISGGCIDADVALQAMRALEIGQSRSLRYGAGSPFTDLPLPCGGAIELIIDPAPDIAAITACRERLQARKPAHLCLSAANGFKARYTPKLRLRIAGRGADCLALARLASASGIETVLQLRDGEDISHARQEGFEDAEALETPTALPANCDDPFTAFVLMFHDTDWEVPLLQQALDGAAFYVGAVGSARTHQRRTQQLLASGVAQPAVNRIRGPIGLIGSMRDASMLAVSAMAEIVEAYHIQKSNVLASTAVILLAAGQSTRFENGDKLLADLDGAPLLERSARLLQTVPCAARIAVTAPGQAERASILARHGWTIVENPVAKDGQSTSLRTGVEAARQTVGAASVMILLADMPGLSDAHLFEVATRHAEGYSAVMSEADGIFLPPAMFSDETFDALCGLTGDTGAKSVFAKLSDTAAIALRAEEARDVDTLADLMASLETRYA